MEKTWQDYISINSTIEGARAAFEVDCAMLLRAMYPGQKISIVRANPGDEGIDIYIGNMVSGPIEIYQCKFFVNNLGDSQKQQIRESFNTAISSKKFNVCKWHLLTPIDEFDIKESIWWDGWSAKCEKDFDIKINIIKGLEIKQLLKINNLYSSVFKIEESIKLDIIRDGINAIIKLLSPKITSRVVEASAISKLIELPAFEGAFELNYTLNYEDFYVTRQSDIIFNSSLISPKNIWIHGLSGVGKTMTCKRNLKKGNKLYIYLYLNVGKAPQTAGELLENIYDNIYSQFEDTLSGVQFNNNNIVKNIVSLLKRVAKEEKIVIVIDEVPLTDNIIFKEFANSLVAICVNFANVCQGSNTIKFIVSTIKNPSDFHEEKQKASEFFTFLEIASWEIEELALLTEKIYNKLGIILGEEQTKDLLTKSNSPRVIKSVLYSYVLHNSSKSFEKLLKEELDKA